MTKVMSIQQAVIVMMLKLLSNIKIENAKVYGTATELNYDLTNNNDKSQLYSNFVAFQCDGCSTAPLTQYRRSEIYQELTAFDKYFTNSYAVTYITVKEQLQNQK